MQIDDQIFFQRSEERAQRVLHPAHVVEPSQHVNARIDDEGFLVAEGDDLLMYFEQDRQFMRQDVRVTAVRDVEESPPGAVLGFEVTGPVVSAESRQCYRVNTVLAELKAHLGGEHCDLTDVSVMGFSLIAETAHAIGDRLDAVLRYEDQEYVGQGAIQSIKQLPFGIRYGILPVAEPGTKSDLPTGLRRMSMGLQRTQLQRRAGV